VFSPFLTRNSAILELVRLGRDESRPNLEHS